MNQTIESKNKMLVLKAFDTLFNKHDYAGSLPDCEQALGPAPDDQIMLVAAATAAEQIGDKAKAAKYYKHLLELDKNNQQAKDGLSRVGG